MNFKKQLNVCFIHTVITVMEANLPAKYKCHHSQPQTWEPGSKTAMKEWDNS